MSFEYPDTWDHSGHGQTPEDVKGPALVNPTLISDPTILRAEDCSDRGCVAKQSALNFPRSCGHTTVV